MTKELIAAYSAASVGLSTAIGFLKPKGTPSRSAVNDMIVVLEAHLETALKNFNTAVLPDTFTCAGCKDILDADETAAADYPGVYAKAKAHFGGDVCCACTEELTFCEGCGDVAARDELDGDGYCPDCAYEEAEGDRLEAAHTSFHGAQR